jgi:hypothetical protein
MRALMVVAVVALLTAPAYSQEMSGGKKGHGREHKSDQESKKPDDKAYNAALSRIPAQKFDPWRDAR